MDLNKYSTSTDPSLGNLLAHLEVLEKSEETPRFIVDPAKFPNATREQLSELLAHEPYFWIDDSGDNLIGDYRATPDYMVMTSILDEVLRGYLYGDNSAFYDDHVSMLDTAGYTIVELTHGRKALRFQQGIFPFNPL